MKRVIKYNFMNNFRTIYEGKDVYGTRRKLELSGDRFTKTIEELRKIVHASMILDIGCGDGFFTNELTYIFPKSKVYGMDISKKAIKKASIKYKKIKFVFGNSEEKLPFPKNCFDLIFCGEIVEHIVDIDKFFIEIRKVLKKDGLIIITTPNLVSWINRILVIFGKWPFYMEPSLRTTIPVISLFGKNFPDTNSQPAGHLRIYSRGALEKVISIYSLCIVKVVGISYLSNSLLRAVDRLFTFHPSLATGLLIIAKKE